MFVKSGIAKKELHKENATIFDEGDLGDAVFIVETGSVGIFREGADGSPVQLATLGAGEMFGEMAVIDGSPRMASAVALEDSIVVRIHRDVLEAKLEKFDPFLQALVKILVNNLRTVHRVYMKRPRSVQDHLNAVTHHAKGLRDFAESENMADPGSEAAGGLDALENTVTQLRILFSGHRDRRRSVIGESDVSD